jgi:hypothetical protein
VLEYTGFRNFITVIAKAREACASSGHAVSDHFVEINEMVNIGSAAQRELQDWKLSRYACYLVIQNADPSKPLVALGQTYFAVQTRRQEMADDEVLKEDKMRLLLRAEMKKHNKNLAGVAKQSGVVDPLDYAIFMDHGYRGLYGGSTINAAKTFLPRTFTVVSMSSISVGPWGVVSGEARIERRAGSSSFFSSNRRIASMTIAETCSAGTFAVRAN